MFQDTMLTKRENVRAKVLVTVQVIFYPEFYPRIFSKEHIAQATK